MWYYALIKDSMGYEVENRIDASSKQEAFEKLRRTAPELKLKDVHRSKMQY